MLFFESKKLLSAKARNLLKHWLFRDGGRYNCAIARVLLASALALTMAHNDRFLSMVSNWDTWRASAEVSGWSPKGLIKLADLFWSGPPPTEVVQAIFWGTCAAIVFMLVGFLTFPAQLAATLGAVFIVSLETSFGAYWSHAYNVQLLAALAFMFSRRSADVLSVDAAIRGCRGKAPLRHEGHYWWPVIFAELATALFMFGAFFQKFREAGVYWALSDNIRNSLGITWFQYRSDPPEIALFIANHPTVWQVAGLLQLFAQATTILAAFLVTRPVFRLVFGGLFFLAEISALTHVFRFWHPFWVPLCGLSVDWEHFVRQMRGRRARLPTASGSTFFRRCVGFLFQKRIEDTTSPSGRARSGMVAPVLAFGTAFFGYYLANIVFKLGEQHLNYPFSSMAFYSETRATRPYSQHRPWPTWTGRIDVYRPGETTPVPVWARFTQLEDQIFRVNSVAALRAIDAAFNAQLAQGLNVLSDAAGDRPFVVERIAPARIDYRAGLMAVPAYPAPLGMEDYHMALRAVRDNLGFRALVTHADLGASRPYIEIRHEGFRAPSFEILIAQTESAGNAPSRLRKVDGAWKDDRYYLTEKIGEPRYLLVRVRDEELRIDETYYGADVF